MLLITIFNQTAEFESLNNCFIGASERRLYFIKHNILCLNVKSNNIYSNLACSHLSTTISAISCCCCCQWECSTERATAAPLHLEQGQCTCLDFSSEQLQQTISSLIQTTASSIRRLLLLLASMILRAKKSSENHKAANFPRNDCTNHIPAYPRPANHVAIKSPPRNSPLTSCLARCEVFDLFVHRFWGQFCIGKLFGL